MNPEVSWFHLLIKARNPRDDDAKSENVRTAATIKAQLSKFSGIVTQGLSKSKQRLIKEMIYRA